MLTTLAALIAVVLKAIAALIVKAIVILAVAITVVVTLAATLIAIALLIIATLAVIVEPLLAVVKAGIGVRAGRIVGPRIFKTRLLFGRANRYVNGRQRLHIATVGFTILIAVIVGSVGCLAGLAGATLAAFT